MYWPFTAASGWNRLLPKYAAAAEPPGARLTGQTIKAGAVRWRLCVTVVLAEQGLYLHPRPFLGSVLGGPRPVLIPWRDLGNPRGGHIYVWWRAVQLSVGDPKLAAITFPMALYEQMRPRIFPAPR